MGSGRLRGPEGVAIAAVVAAVFLGALDQTVIVAALPAIVVDLQIPLDQLDQAAWVVSGYLLGYTVALPLMGRFADVRGRRLALALSLGIFAVGSLGCALAETLAILIGARIVQAAGAGALLPVAIAVVSDRYPAERRVLAIGLVGAVAEAGGVLGPPYGAGLISVLPWRWIFWINVPVATLLLGTGLACLRNDPPGEDGRIDLAGALLIAVALGAEIVGLAHEPVRVAGIDLRTGLAIGAIGAFGTFVAWERRATDPLLALGLFRDPGFAAAMVGGGLLGGALIVAMVDVPLYAATILDLSPSDGGLLLSRLTVLIPIGAVVGGWLGQRSGLGVPTALGFLAASLGLGMMSQWNVAPGQPLLWASLVTAGLGFGLLIAPLSTAAVNRGGVGREASAAALFSVARLTGMTLGLSVLTAWGLQRFESLAAGIPSPLPRAGESAADYQARLAAYEQALRQIAATVYHDLFLGAAILALLGLATAIALDPRVARKIPTGPRWPS